MQYSPCVYICQVTLKAMQQLDVIPLDTLETLNLSLLCDLFGILEFDEISRQFQYRCEPYLPCKSYTYFILLYSFVLWWCGIAFYQELSAYIYSCVDWEANFGLTYNWVNHPMFKTTYYVHMWLVVGVGLEINSYIIFRDGLRNMYILVLGRIHFAQRNCGLCSPEFVGFSKLPVIMKIPNSELAIL